MKRNYFAGLTVLALAAICAAQTAVPPPPNCLTAAKANQQSTGCPAPLPPLAGGGTPNVIPLFTSPSTIGDSVITQSASGSVGIGGANAGGSRLSVAGGIAAQGNVSASGNVSAAGNVIAANISASGVVAGSQFNVGPIRALAVSGSNTLVGIGAGSTNIGSTNSFFGFNAGINNMANNNSAFGAGAGQQNTTGLDNVFVGLDAGQFNLTGSHNAYVGAGAGTGGDGSDNTFLGYHAANNFGSGHNNTVIGAGATVSAGVQNATVIGSRASASHSDTLILGGFNGVNGSTPVNVGIGTDDPPSRLTVSGGDIYISDSTRSLILKIPGTNFCSKLIVDLQGNIHGQFMSCPGDNGF